MVLTCIKLSIFDLYLLGGVSGYSQVLAYFVVQSEFKIFRLVLQYVQF